jgi:hypothetical protein
MERFHRAVDLVYTQTVLRTLGYLEGTFPAPASENPVIHLGPPEALPLLEAAHETTEVPQSEDPIPGEGEEEGPVTFKRVGSIIQKLTENEDLSHTVAFIASGNTPLFAGPTKAFDTVITTLPYGSMVMVMEEKGRFSKVSQNGLIGYVLRDELRARAAHVFPEFIVGTPNEHDSSNTLRVRACIKDAFFGGEIEADLQAGEYVLYMLSRKNQGINWPPTRPRTPGLWHTILRGIPGIHVGITPKTGSILEYTLHNDMGHLAYVEAVFPDNRISLSEVNYPDHGIYHERTLTKEEWQALNPIFIQVS